ARRHRNALDATQAANTASRAAGDTPVAPRHSTPSQKAAPSVAMPTTSGALERRRSLMPDGEIDGARGDRSAADGQLADRNRQREAARAGAARIDEEHAGPFLDRRPMRMAGDDDA